MRRCRSEIWLRFPEKKPEPSKLEAAAAACKLGWQLAKGIGAVHQLHSDARIPTTPLLIAVHAVHR